MAEYELSGCCQFSNALRCGIGGLAHNRLDPEDGVVIQKVVGCQAQSGHVDEIARPAVVRWQLEVVVRPHGEDGKDQSELLEVNLVLAGRGLLSVSPLKDGLEGGAWCGVVTRVSVRLARSQVLTAPGRHANTHFHA